MSLQETAAPVVITLPDGTAKTFESGVTALDIAASISEGLARATLAAEVDGKVVDATRPITRDARVRLLTTRDPEGLEVLRHSTTHLMAQAVKRLYPDAMLEDGPPTPDGFWYDIRTTPPVTPDDFERIEDEMRKIVKEKLPIECQSLSRDEARALFQQRGEKYKLDIVERIPDGAPITVYRQGEFVDLCRGPHVADTGRLKAFKLLSTAGAYWKGDAKNDQLTRIRGTAFGSKDDLKAYLEQIEEAKKRDHRKLGRELGLFMGHEFAPGETFWLPKGKRLYDLLKQLSTDMHRDNGYLEVFTPMLFKKDLFETSGHWKHYRDDMFIVPGQEARSLEPAEVEEWAARLEHELEHLQGDSQHKAFVAEYAEVAKASPEAAKRLGKLLEKGSPLADRHWYLFEKRPGEFVFLSSADGEVYAIKPMNCPSHMLIFRDTRRSYRELPMRIFDQGVLHRNEASGTLSGLTRVRQFCQDDAHIFLMPEQIEAEITRVIGLGQRVYGAFGMSFSQVFLSTRPEKAMGSKEQWDQAEAALKSAIEANGLDYKINEGDGAFYGPKIDFQVKDALGRAWQTMTIQLDYQLPQRFNLKYIAPDGSEQTPVVVHRALFGSFERFIGVLIEHYAGDFPAWLAPEQVRVLTISEKFVEYGREVAAALRKAGARVELDLRDDKISAKIREAELQKVPYMLIVGQKEQENRAVSVRSRAQGDEGSKGLEAWIEEFRAVGTKVF